VTTGRIRNGTSNTLLLMESGDSDVVWTEPRDLSVEAAWAVFQQASQHGDGHHILLCDGSVRYLEKLSQDIFVRIVNSGSRTSIGPADRLPLWLRGQMPAEVARWGPTKVANELKSTEVVGSPHLPLDAERSQIWCATFQMAWDQLREQFGNQQVDLQPAIPLSDALNEHPFPKKAVAPECTLLHAATTGPADDRRLRAEFAERFPDAPVRIEDSADDPSRLRIYAYLEKRLLFFDGLERFPTPMQFGAGTGAKVESFGVPGKDSAEEGSRVLEHEVFVRDYVSDQDFIIELATESKQQDRVILAQVTPLVTLADTWSQVANRIRMPNPQHKRPHLLSTETLRAPVLALNLQREYQELYDGVIQSGDLPATIQLARQEIRFRLDERGATLISLAEIEVLALDGDPVDKPRQFIFDRPFLLAMREGENEPYFLAWIATAEVMETKNEAP
jgi:hypothetical protein